MALIPCLAGSRRWAKSDTALDHKRGGAWVFATALLYPAQYGRNCLLAFHAVPDQADTAAPCRAIDALGAFRLGAKSDRRERTAHYFKGTVLLCPSAAEPRWSARGA